MGQMGKRLLKIILETLKTIGNNDLVLKININFGFSSMQFYSFHILPLLLLPLRHFTKICIHQNGFPLKKYI